VLHTPPPSKLTAIKDPELPASRLPRAHLVPHQPEPRVVAWSLELPSSRPWPSLCQQPHPRAPPAPPEHVIREPPLAPTSSEACMFELPALATGPDTKWSHRNTGATASLSSTLPLVCGPSSSLPGAAVTGLRQ
jgi:hypothetical protein